MKIACLLNKSPIALFTPLLGIMLTQRIRQRIKADSHILKYISTKQFINDNRL